MHSIITRYKMKLNLYKLIHKAQRQRLYELAIAIAKMDENDAEEYEKITQSMKQLLSHIKQHSQSEERFIHPYFEPFAQQLNRLNQQHQQLDVMELSLIQHLTAGKDSHQLYLAFNRFIASYLQHIDEEERLQSEILWQQYRNEDLQSIMVQFNQSLSAEEIEEGLKFMLPCLKVQETLELLQKKPRDFPQR
nr:hypothetical protein [Legionella jordanis]